MPGGSGLLEQALERWDEVIGAALEVLATCESACERACQDCMWTYRNQYVHRYLDRHRALRFFKDHGREIPFSHPIPARLPAAAPKHDGMPVNAAEDRLRDLLKAAGFPPGEWQKQIALGQPLGSTTPDVFFMLEDEDEPGVCVYLDGLSDHIHGNDTTKKKDQQVRETLRSLHYEVVEIPASHLDDKDQMAWHFKRMARILMGKAQAKTLVRDTSWFTSAETQESATRYSPGESIALEVAEDSSRPSASTTAQGGAQAVSRDSEGAEDGE